MLAVAAACHSSDPARAAAERFLDLHYVEIDITEDPEIAESAGVVGTPTVQFFRDKSKVGEMMGVKQKSQYREAIESHLA